MKLRRCDCDGPRVQLHRSWWMRLLFPRRRLFVCRACSCTMLVKPPRELRRLP